MVDGPFREELRLWSPTWLETLWSDGDEFDVNGCAGCKEVVGGGGGGFVE